MSGQDRKRGYDLSEPSTSSGYGKKKPCDRGSESVSKKPRKGNKCVFRYVKLKTIEIEQSYIAQLGICIFCFFLFNN